MSGSGLMKKGIRNERERKGGKGRGKKRREAK